MSHYLSVVPLLQTCPQKPTSLRDLGQAFLACGTSAVVFGHLGDQVGREPTAEARGGLRSPTSLRQSQQ